VVDKLDVANAPVQAIEVTPDKKIVWALRAWTGRRLGHPPRSNT